MASLQNDISVIYTAVSALCFYLLAYGKMQQAIASHHYNMEQTKYDYRWWDWIFCQYL